MPVNLITFIKFIIIFLNYIVFDIIELYQDEFANQIISLRAVILKVKLRFNNFND